MQHERHLGLFGATAVGVGAIVGGGILALAGVAFATAGPGAIVAFALNGGIAFLTVASFAQLARRFPESGGVYAYAKKVLTIEVAFVVGWVVWFASIVAGVLYALGFSAFAAEGLGRLLPLLGRSPAWLEGPALRLGIALAAILLYTLGLIRRAAGGGKSATIGKVIVFSILIVGGIWAWVGASPPELLGRLDPFLSAGPLGVVQAMGYTFIALQGFDLIAAVGGEVRDPERNLPRAMYLSLGIALVIYLPLLFVIATVGAPAEGGIAAVGAANPEGLVAEATERFLGTTGYWLVIGAGVLSMLSALNANLLGASRVAFAMARDRTLPHRLGQIRGASGTPAVAIVVTGLMVAVIAVAVGEVAAAGAAASLIFLISFAMVHWAANLADRRSGLRRPGVVPLLGATLCLSLAIFQAFAVPDAGIIVTVLLALGVALYLTLFAPGARLADVAAEARDPDLARLRGRSPLVLVPIANPVSAASLVDIAATVRTPGVGRILLLSVVRTPDGELDEDDPALRDAQGVLSESLHQSLKSSLIAETLFTIASDVWREIARVARVHRCETVLMGLPNLTAPGVEMKLEGLVGTLEADVVIVCVPHRWQIAEAKHVLVPLGGRRQHSRLRARLLASVSRSGERSITFLRTLPPAMSTDTRRRFERTLRQLARDEAAGPHEVIFEYTDHPREAIIRHAADADLVVMGVQPRGRGPYALGALPLAIARESEAPLVLIGRRPARSRGFTDLRFRSR
jgi:amino acid transporter/nucleotide-binding universal stress UspA family protein